MTRRTQPNHLMGYRREYIALSFRNQTDLFSVRRDLLPLANKNREMLDAVDTYAEVVAGESTADQLGGAAMEIDMEDAWGMGGGGRGGFVKDIKDKQMNPQDAILDIREYDVPYYLRVAIDKSESPSSRTPLAQLCGGKAESNAVGKLV